MSVYEYTYVQVIRTYMGYEGGLSPGGIYCITLVTMIDSGAGEGWVVYSGTCYNSEPIGDWEKSSAGLTCRLLDHRGHLVFVW